MARTPLSATGARLGFGAVVAGVAEDEVPVVVHHDALGDWLARVDRIRERINHERGDAPWPDPAELIRAGREERDAAILAGLR